MSAAHGVTIYDAVYDHDAGTVEAHGFAKPRQANTFAATLLDRGNNAVAGPVFVTYDPGDHTWHATLITGTLTGGETYVLEVSRTLPLLQGGHTFADYRKIDVSLDLVRRKPRRRQQKRKPPRRGRMGAAQGS